SPPGREDLSAFESETRVFHDRAPATPDPLQDLLPDRLLAEESTPDLVVDGHHFAVLHPGVDPLDVAAAGIEAQTLAQRGEHRGTRAPHPRDDEHPFVSVSRMPASPFSAGATRKVQRHGPAVKASLPAVPAIHSGTWAVSERAGWFGLPSPGEDHEA